jgi:hypothetical protein
MKKILSILLVTLIIVLTNNHYSQSNTKTYNCFNTSMFRVLSDNSPDPKLTPKLIKTYDEKSTIIISDKTIFINSKIEGEKFSEEWNIISTEDDVNTLTISTKNILGEKGDIFMLYKNEKMIVRMTYLAEANETIMLTYSFK